MYFNATSHAVNQTNSQLITGSALTQLKFCHIVWLIWSMANNRKTQDYGYNQQSGGNVAMMLHNNGELEERKVFSLQNCTFFCKSHLHECTLIVSWEKVSKHILYANIKQCPPTV